MERFYLPPEIKGVVFDIGNVLVPYNEDNVIDMLRSYTLNISYDALFNLLFRSFVHLAFFMGYITPAKFYESIRIKSDLRLTEREFFFIYNKVFQEPNQDIVRFLLECKKADYKIGVLSNIDKNNFHFLYKKYNWFKSVDKFSTSFGVQYLKPDYRPFCMMEKKLGIKGEEIFYLDDNRSNLDTAEKRRWHTHLVEL